MFVKSKSPLKVFSVIREKNKSSKKGKDPLQFEKLIFRNRQPVHCDD